MTPVKAHVLQNIDGTHEVPGDGVAGIPVLVGVFQQSDHGVGAAEYLAPIMVVNLLCCWAVDVLQSFRNFLTNPLAAKILFLTVRW